MKRKVRVFFAGVLTTIQNNVINVMILAALASLAYSAYSAIFD